MKGGSPDTPILKVSSELTLDDSTSEERKMIRMCATSSKVAVTWSSKESGVYNLVGDIITKVPITGDYYSPSIVSFTGSFFLVWLHDDGTNYHIRSQSYLNDGTERGVENVVYSASNELTSLTAINYSAFFKINISLVFLSY